MAKLTVEQCLHHARRLRVLARAAIEPSDRENLTKAAEAYEVLSDTDKRAQYDRYGHAGVSGAGRGPAGGQNMEDIFSQFGDIFGEDIFGSFFGGPQGPLPAGIRKTGAAGEAAVWEKEEVRS